MKLLGHTDLNELENILKEKGMTISKPTIITYLKDKKAGRKIGHKWYIENKDVDSFVKKMLGKDDGRS